MLEDSRSSRRSPAVVKLGGRDSDLPFNYPPGAELVADLLA